MRSDLTPEQMRVLAKLAADFQYYSANCLKIIDRSGEMIPFVFNKAQRFLHAKLEKIKQDTGMVRAVILKGRQEGCTTYTQGRFFHKTQFLKNKAAFVLAHQIQSTLKIFAMTRRFRENSPESLHIPLTKDTEKAMEFDNGSSYTVGTAGSSDIGRGLTIQFLHASEPAFYENADQITTGLLQAVADIPGTEVIFESTANGPAGFFYDMVQGAIAGTNGYHFIFIPWYWCDDYMDSTPLKINDLDEYEQTIYEAYKSNGLTLYHLSWRRKKIASFGGKLWKFQQEYPTTPEEAFVRADARFFDLTRVTKARGAKVVPMDQAPLVIGIDQGRKGDDTSIARRRGNIIMPFETIPGDNGHMRDMRLAGRVARIIDREHPDLVVFDTTNEHGALDRLHELGYSRKLVKGIHFGERADDPQRHRNKRVEMHFEFRDWLDEEDKEIPDDQQFISEISSIPEEKYSSNSVAFLVAKDEIKKVLGWSPNKLDATCLTFAFKVRRKRKQQDDFRTVGTNQTSGKFKSALKTIAGK